MGVRDLTPFLRRRFPDVIKYLPDRLKSLAGKTLVIDGTLITQRIYWSPMPHKHRHVLGWYRLISELRAADVKAITVFDGKERNMAKLAEARRRQFARQVLHERSSMEAERLKRLKELVLLLGAYRATSGVEDALMEPCAMDDSVAEQLERSGQPQGTPPPELWTVSPERDVFEASTSTADHADLLTTREDIESGGLDNVESALTETTITDLPARDEQSKSLGVSKGPDKDFPEVGELETIASAPIEGPITTLPGIDELEELLEASLGPVPSEGIVPEDVTTTIPTRELTEADTSQPVIDELGEDFDSPDDLNDTIPAADVALEDITTTIVADEPTEVETQRTQISTPMQAEILDRLITLKQEYEGSLPRSAALAQIDADTLKRLEEELPKEILESKLQRSLSFDEGQLWDALDSGLALDEGFDPETVTRLASRSQVISRSYEKRSQPPSSETYEESRMLLDAMGVPCIVCDGPYEGEALASSLVINGRADFIATEDTDVLIYGAPMLRSITDRSKPLVLISGAEVRAQLALSQPAFIDFALLLGTDFSQRLEGVGPVRAFRFIQEYGSIEAFVERETRYAPSADRAAAYLEMVARARDVFATLPPVPSEEALRQREIDETEVTRLLMQFGLSRAIADEPSVDWDPQAALAGNYFGDSPWEGT